MQTINLTRNTMNAKHARMAKVQHKKEFLKYILHRVVFKQAHKEIEEPCWLWTMAVNDNGYPKSRWGHLYPYLVHRKVAVTINDEDLTNKTVHHKCAERLCLNPSHLEVITQRENTGEMFARKFYEAHIKELSRFIQENLEQLSTEAQADALRLLAVSM